MISLNILNNFKVSIHMFLILLCASKVVIECDHKVCLSVNSVHIHMKGEAKIRSVCGAEWLLE